jgi:hypothetical protein
VVAKDEATGYFFLAYYLICNVHIHILLIKPNIMIYICYIFSREVKTCVLAVIDDKHDVGDDDDASSDSAGGREG